ncbi:MAG: peptidylprolyl isomerase [Planctomycetaceae bacterium]|nr:peptidylprolyl isomerase [Planctomycetaceae bacterium]
MARFLSLSTISSVSATCLLGAVVLLAGCAEPEQDAPPVLDVLSDMNDVDLARRAEQLARRQEAMKAIQEAGAEFKVPTEGVYVAEFETTAGTFQIEVHRDWAPYGADRFYKLIKDGFYKDAAFFRVMKGFMVQWGIAARPGMTQKWDDPIPDDEVFQSNQRGYVSFAQTKSPHSRSTQVFINYTDNSNLDTMDQGFAPFGKIIMGMDVVDAINGQHGQKPDQVQIRARGNAYLKEKFPELDLIKSVRLVVDDQPETADEGDAPSEAADAQPQSSEDAAPDEEATGDAAADEAAEK